MAHFFKKRLAIVLLLSKQGCFDTKFKCTGAAAIALWFHLHLPSCSPGFESQAHYLHFFQFVLLKL